MSELRVLLIGTNAPRERVVAALNSLSRATCVGQIAAVVDETLEPIDRVRYATPGGLSARAFGAATATRICAARAALRDQPHVMIAVEQTRNAAAVLFAARSARAKTVFLLTNTQTNAINDIAHVARHFDLLIVNDDAARRLLLDLGAPGFVRVVSSTPPATPQTNGRAHAAANENAAQWERALRDVCDEGTAADVRLQASRRVSINRARLWQNLPQRWRNIVTPIIHMLPPKTWLGSRFRLQRAFVQEAERWTAERAAAHQLRELQRTLRRAYERTDFYYQRMRECGFQPDDLQSLDDLRRLPLLDRATVRENCTDMQTIPPSHTGADWVSTGGTSGQPLRLRMSQSRSATEFAYLVQSWSRCGYSPEIPLAVLRGEVVQPDPRNGLRHAYDPLLRRHNYSNFHMDDESIARYLAHMATIGPFYLFAYPSAVTSLARFIKRGGAKAPRNVRGILAGSEITYPDDRTLAEQVFGVRYFSWYGMTEKVALAAECEHSTDMHVWPTYGYLELLDESGQPVTQPGQTGEIVGTSFLERVTPLIRYRTGDYATYVADHCPQCGRQQMIVRDVAGHRTQELLVASDHSLISWTSLNMHDDTFENVRQFQFSQDAPGRAILKVVPTAEFGAADAERIRARLDRKLDGRLAFQVVTTDEIRLTPRGKATYVDQRLDIERLSAAEVARR